MTSYLTVPGRSEAELIVKRSRFLATVARVEEEAAVREVVAALRKEHWDAGHHCSAFIIGADRGLQRSSDDGEPAGTAGAPMLEVLRGAELSDVVAVVTRWFGGVLLGAGGLVRAYGDAVRAALDSTGTLRRELMREFTVSLDHGVAGRVESDLRSRGVVVAGVEYAATATLRLAVPETDAGSLAPLLAELTGGLAEPVVAGERWVDRSA